MLLFNYHVLFLIILGFVKKKKQQQPYRELFRPKGTLLIVFLIEVFSVFVVTLNAPAQYFLVFVFLFLGGGAGGLGVGFSLCHELNLCLATTRELPSNSTSDQSKFYAKLC